MESLSWMQLLTDRLMPWWKDKGIKPTDAVTPDHLDAAIELLGGIRAELSGGAVTNTGAAAIAAAGDERG